MITFFLIVFCSEMAGLTTYQTLLVTLLVYCTLEACQKDVVTPNVFAFYLGVWYMTIRLLFNHY